MAKILVFDSGVGGLSIADAIFKKSPEHQLIFASDNGAYPYGTKSVEELLPRVTDVVSQLIKQTVADILVVACNTASTVALPELRKLLPIDVVGVVPAIKPAALVSQTKSIGLLATPATIKRPYTQNLIDTHAQDCEIEMIGSSELVELAEQKLHFGRVDNSKIQKIVQPWLAVKSQVDTIILACTHFPLLKKELIDIFSAHHKQVKWVDSATGIAKRVDYLLQQKLKANSMIQSATHRKIDTNAQAENTVQKKNYNRAIFTKKEEFTSEFKRSLSTLEIEDLYFL